MALNIDRAVQIVDQLVGRDATTVATLPQAVAQAASGDPISATIAAETAPGLDLVNDVDNVKAAAAFFSVPNVPNALTVAQLRAAFGLLSALPKAG